MPITYACNAADRITTWTVSDPVGVGAWTEALDRAENDPEVQRVRPLGAIVDIRGRSEFPLRPTVQLLSNSLRERLTRRRISRFPVAVIVTTQEAHGMAHMAASYVGDAVEVQVFLELGAARQWVLTRATEFGASGER